MTIPEQQPRYPYASGGNDPTSSATGGGWAPPATEEWRAPGQNQGQWTHYQQQQYQYPYQQAQYGYTQQPYSPASQRRGRKVAAGVVGGVVLLALVGGAGFAAGWSAHSSSTSTAANSPFLPLNPDSNGNGGGTQGGGSDPFGNGQQQGGGSDPFGNGQDNGGQQQQGGTTAGGATQAQVTAVAGKVDSALVDINTVLGAENGEAAGTGIVLTSNGIILTNNHVVAGATAISVTDIGNHKVYQAAVVGYDRSDDVAIVQLKNASGLATASLATSQPKTGDPVVAIGNAGGTGGTPSAVGGAVTALNQSITASDESSGSSEQLTGLIQVNAPIQAGDSGGPLLNVNGQVLGMDTAAGQNFSFQGGSQGYAIPIASATSIGNQIRGSQSSAKVHIGSTAYLGVLVTGAQGQGESQTSGAAISDVVQGAPAASAGLARGDVITAVAGSTVGSATDLTNLLDRHHPGDSVKVTWTDISGQSHSANVKLATGPVG